MKKALICFGVLIIYQSSANAQFLKKLQEKAANAAEKVIDKKIEQKTDKLIGTGEGNSNNTNSTENTVNNGNNNSVNRSGAGAGSRNRMSNTEGGGLITTPPDVKENLNSAEDAFKGSNYGAARYAVQQAILGIEMEIGSKILKSLPETVAGIAKQADQDEVSSSGWGWAGLNINRTYQNDKKQFMFIIANNSMLSAVNQFLVGGAYGQSTGGQQKWKQIMVKGNKAIIEYDADSGYKVSIPLGQSSLLAFEGVNFASEQDMIAAVNEFNIEEIRKTLGEK